jgi:hypothetical protein
LAPTGRLTGGDAVTSNPLPSIRIDEVGQITSGDQAGRFVLVKDDQEGSGGYLIFTASDREFTKEVFDNWVTDIAMVERFFIEAHWRVTWLDDPK